MTSVTEDREIPRPRKSEFAIYEFLVRHENALLGSFTMIVALLLWEAVVRLDLVNPLFTSSPSRIIATGYAMFADGSIYPHLAISGLELVVGYGLAIIVGVPLGILMGWYRRFDAAFDPIISALYATPRIALLPLIMIWFGIGLGSKFAIIFLSAVFPILINTTAGVQTVERDYIKVARSFGANDRQMFLTVAFPAAVPFLLTGLRLGLGHALIGIVVGEMYSAQAGVGYLISVAGATFQTDRVMFGIILIAAAGVVLTNILRMIERRFDRWRPDNKL
ncbi:MULTISPECIES: ABC transporter permease [unclassified Sinorhizobium]|uniref:ABC transporter permease n=1 Tax=unclassified Sinorhizobium TaxID=2613772 RepID=UPI0024C404C8|nr:MULTISPECIES: ABC transporter permease [unclassified Sinorhizobium]MDK1375015.1 ABC transporter permease [Sinorhizobium sp. 6-70]MDK1483091.1 ABC transporter permease [Sinorhizobium sp. 6-117]